MTAPDSRRYFLAGYLSAELRGPGRHRRHPETLLPLADRILAVLNELAADEVDESR